MLETNAPQPKKLQRVCIRCGDTHLVSLSQCPTCGFDLTSDLQRDYDFYRDGIPLDAPTGVGERNAEADGPEPSGPRQRVVTQPGFGPAHWKPYRESAEGTDTDTQLKATMDLGAAVLEAVFEGGSQGDLKTLELEDIAPLLVDAEATPMPDPVGWSPTKGLRIEDPVIVGDPAPQASDTREEEPAVVGAIYDWPSEESAVSPSPKEPVLAPGGDEGHLRASPQAEEKRVLSTAPVRVTHAEARGPLSHALLAERVVRQEPVSQRNHIRAGATTYVDAMQGNVRRPTSDWWRHDLALPLAIAIGLVSFLIIAVM